MPSRRGPDHDATNPLVAAVAHHMHLQDEDAPAPPQGPPRDSGGSFFGFFAWVVLLAAVGATVWMQWAGPVAVPPAATEMAPPGGLMRIAGRYAVGAASLGGTMPEGLSDELVGQLDTFAVSPEDRLRAVIVQAEIAGPELATEALDGLVAELESAEEPLLYADVLLADAAAVRGLLADPPLAPADADGFRERHGWFGDLALAQGLDDDSPARAPVLSKARRTLLVAVTGVGAFVVLCLVGFVLGIVAVVLRTTGRLRGAYAPPAPGGSVYLEVFALFLLGFLGVSYVAAMIEQATGFDPSRLLIWLLLLVPLWALVRGAPSANFRYAMGWHTGKGLFRELGAGLVGYVACLPIFLGGIALTLLLGVLMSFFSGPADSPAAPPTHPIIDQIDASNVLAILGVYALAAVWAPLVEESLFRGAFYHHLRGRLHPLLAGLGVAFVFAVIHPQGIIAVPALMSLAVVFALLREWRGSLIAPVAAHAAHNATLMTALILLLS